ncbi:AI-2E family transporter [Kordiimonas sp. SCSIO 12610]|uniref:AI-2E family transporter n=1 Tax=Kordiimonas sp. SCSIO 12610 TaxID=2829597 RepID=UPI00210E9ABC|nr:AI-2E family transporter [Kordiimonas sp. SCSIO 12610]UTW53888.1 AI-2E family transporter [Kordiimonas sp. SCSIO 12610]
MNKKIWWGAALVVILVIYLTKAVLFPFLAGLAVAYFLDPLADKFEERKVPRSAAAGIVIGFFFLVLLAMVLALVPVLRSQFEAFATVLPKTLASLRPWLNDTIALLSDKFGLNLGGDVDGVLHTFSDQIMARGQKLAGSILQNSLAVFNLMSLLLISPVVAFYFLRDWDLLVDKINGWLPPSHATVIREQVGKVDEVLAGFVRGQMLVCLVMGIMYSIGWSLVGLNFGLVLGVLAGIMAFIPFVGVIFALAIALIIGVGQWGLDFQNLGLVSLVFLVVQVVEGAYLTPRLVGERVGLHPVWVLFAVFAGGEIMGFVGVLIAVPAAAAIAVVVRYMIGQYLEHYDIVQETDEEGGKDTDNAELPEASSSVDDNDKS